MQIIAISRSQGVAMLEDGSLVPFVNMFDEFGEETRDVTECCTAVVALPDGTWDAIDVSDFEKVTVH